MKDIFTKEWWNATGVRMIRTFAEGALSYVGTGALFLGDVNWLAMLSAGTFASILSFLFALTGLPEVNE